MNGEERHGPPRWWQFPWHEIASFGLGAFLLVWQNSVEETPSAVIVGAGVALCGVTAAGAVQRIAKRANGKG